MLHRFKLLIAMLLAVVGCAVTAGPAAAHYGDWQSQYNYASYDAGSVGYAAETGGNDYRGHAYVTSFVYGAHSRQFNWHMYFVKSNGQRITCRFINRIDHNLSVFTRATEACWVGW